MTEEQKQAKVFLYFLLLAEQEHLNTLEEVCRKSPATKLKYRERIKKLKERMLPKQAFFNRDLEKETDKPVPLDFLDQHLPSL
tara:strand:- start:133 stop:381 length:249 start_codon:yes stop_codon:yes gene_type:complete